MIDVYLEVMAALTAERQRANDHNGAIAAAREIVDLDPFNESAHRALMQAYAAAGRRGQALRQYLACRRALVVELGVEPAETTTALHARLLAGEEI